MVLLKQEALRLTLRVSVVLKYEVQTAIPGVVLCSSIVSYRAHGYLRSSCEESPSFLVMDFTPVQHSMSLRYFPKPVLSLVPIKSSWFRKSPQELL